MDNLVGKIDNTIKWSFYLLFFLVPLIIWPDTFELFEFNKMWAVFGFSIFIFFLWGSKIAINGKFELRRTPLDIPIALFLLSQIVSTIFSIDVHTSIWGYYSRFNGGLLSTIAYIFLYYAFASNLVSSKSESKHVSYSLLIVILLSGLAVTLWGLPSHFGADPTCFFFRGTFNTSCWTDQFQPTVRIFSTLGQPNWLGTFLAALIPISLGMGAFKFIEDKNKLLPALYLGLTFLFLLALIYTRSQSSYLGMLVGVAVFFGILVIKNLKSFRTNFLKNKTGKYILTALIVLASTTLIIGTPSGSINRYITIGGIASMMITHPTTPSPTETKAKQETGLENNTTIQFSGTESSTIRLIVWQGALELFKKNPLFGTGVETYAYAYYGVKPLAHNLTSEWDYLYNKAHNEYLNYLATTGLFGLLTYMSIIALFFYKAFVFIKKRNEHENSIGVGIVGGYSAILLSNFFGFSVVPINLLFFILPLLFFEIVEPSSLRTVFKMGKGTHNEDGVGMGAMSIILILAIVALFLEFRLLNFWSADKKYALGNNLDKAGQPTQAYTPLTEAVTMLPSEDLYKDELAINMATLAILFNENKNATQAAAFGQQAKALSDGVVAAHPNNIVYRKTNIRVNYALAQIDPKYIDDAIAQVQNARKLAPTDAKLLYNLGLFYNQKGDTPNMITAMNEAIRLKPNYADPNYALALQYIQLAKDNPGKAAEYNTRARERLNYILKNIDPNNASAKELLKSL